MPKRNQSQRIGDQAERIVRDLVDDHIHWLARTQDRDFGVDLEAELAEVDENEDQQLTGKLIKIQVKGSLSLETNNGFIAIDLKCDYLKYINQFRLPVILVAVDVRARNAWYIWLQDWLLSNEETIKDTASYIRIGIPVGQTLNSGLNGPLMDISNGNHSTSMVLALRELGAAAVHSRNASVFSGILKILIEIDEPSSAWIVHKTVDALIGVGPHAGIWETQDLLPLLFMLVDRVGNKFTAPQIDRLVRRDDGYSRTSIYALARLYDRWPEHCGSLALPVMFETAGLEQVAWYCRLREHYQGRSSLALFDAFRLNQISHTEFGEFKLPDCQEFASEVTRRWPNRGDWFYLERLLWIGDSRTDDLISGR